MSSSFVSRGEFVEQGSYETLILQQKAVRLRWGAELLIRGIQELPDHDSYAEAMEWVQSDREASGLPLDWYKVKATESVQSILKDPSVTEFKAKMQDKDPSKVAKDVAKQVKTYLARSRYGGSISNVIRLAQGAQTPPVGASPIGNLLNLDGLSASNIGMEYDWEAERDDTTDSRRDMIAAHATPLLRLYGAHGKIWSSPEFLPTEGNVRIPVVESHPGSHGAPVDDGPEGNFAIPIATDTRWSLNHERRPHDAPVKRYHGHRYYVARKSGLVTPLYITAEVRSENPEVRAIIIERERYMASTLASHGLIQSDPEMRLHGVGLNKVYNENRTAGTVRKVPAGVTPRLLRDLQRSQATPIAALAAAQRSR